MLFLRVLLVGRFIVPVHFKQALVKDYNKHKVFGVLAATMKADRHNPDTDEGGFVRKSGQQIFCKSVKIGFH